MLITRKKFIRTSAITTSLFMLNTTDVLSNPYLNNKTNKNFQLKIFATNWGFSGSIDAYCEKVKKEGYDGIEIWWSDEKIKQDIIFKALEKYNLEVGFVTASDDNDFDTHYKSFTEHIKAIATNSQKRPLYINCHSGMDYFTFDQNKQIIDYTIKLAKDTEIKICHETHRSRMLYAAHVAKTFMQKIPELRITLDISHWCNVSESLLGNQQETVALALERTDNIHARIGHAEGPQVNDPRAPEWQAELSAHLAWWDKVVAYKKNKGEVLTILTEFGPPGYMPTVPFTRQPLANQWEINVYMMQLLKKRYL